MILSSFVLDFLYFLTGLRLLLCHLFFGKLLQIQHIGNVAISLGLFYFQLALDTLNFQEPRGLCTLHALTPLLKSLLDDDFHIREVTQHLIVVEFHVRMKFRVCEALQLRDAI